MEKNQVLRQMLGEDQLIVAPGAYDALTARIIEETGFLALYVGGHALVASTLARPDLRILTRDEFVACAAKITQAISIPVIADGEDGYGGSLQVRRTVEEYEKAEIRAMHIEDHEFGAHFGYGECISVEKMAEKIRAACEAREDSNFLIIGRTDAVCIGKPLDEAIDRAKAYIEVGADAIFIECLTLRGMEKASRALSVPLMGDYYGLMRNEKSIPSLREVKATGLRLIIFPMEMLLTAYAAVRDLARELKDTGTLTKSLRHMTDVEELDRFLGTSGMIELARKYKSC